MRTFKDLVAYIGGSSRRLAILAAILFFLSGVFMKWWQEPAPPATVPSTVAVDMASPAAPVAEALTDWVATRDYDAGENEARHFRKHGAEFPFASAEEYTAVAKSFVTKPPRGTLSVIQKDSDRVYYNPELNFFAVTNRKGQIRTFYRLDPAVHGHDTNMEYFRAQEAR